ncbi:hypothetical protein KCU92_g2964, partial [Aureobasidium melanogenum]
MSVTITITPSSVTLSRPCLLTLSATLSYSSPITIYTWPSVFNLNLAQRRKNFFCIDLSNDNAPVKLETTKGGKRSGHISLELGGIDDEYFRTLVPEKPVDFTAPLIVATRPNKPLVAGHRYRFGMNEGESILYWYEGTREQTMSPPGQDAPAAKDMRTILLDVGPPIEFEVLETQHSEYA